MANIKKLFSGLFFSCNFRSSDSTDDFSKKLRLETRRLVIKDKIYGFESFIEPFPRQESQTPSILEENEYIEPREIYSKLFESQNELNL